MQAARNWLKLKHRVTLALVAIVSLFVIVQGVLAYVSLENQEDEIADEFVLAEARLLAARAEQGALSGPQAADLLAPSPNLSAWLVSNSGQVLPGPLPESFKSLKDGPHRLGRPSDHLHIVVLSTTTGRLYVQFDAAQNEAKVRDFGYYLLALGALCIVLGIAVSRRLAAIVVAPIERLTVRLSNWAPEGRMEDTAHSDEESRLLNAFGRVQSRFEQAIATEREFIANVSHEIRTPLTALRTDLEMLALSTATQSTQLERVRRALAMTDAITGSLESARALTHRRQLQRQPVALAQCVDDAWASLEAYPQMRGLSFANEIPSTATVTADRHALMTILRNLIRNAAEHAAPAHCTVRLSESGIEVADDGPGIAATDIPFVFERYFRGRLVDSPADEATSDRGLGLAIARQVSDLYGWRLTAASGDGRGTRFTLNLKPLPD